MSQRIAERLLSGRQIGARGVQGLSADDGALGPIGNTLPGATGFGGDPGATCACRLDTDVLDVSATGADDGDLIRYGVTGFQLVSQVGVEGNDVNFSTVPVFESATGAAQALGRFKLYRLADDSSLIRMVFRARTLFSRWTTSNSGVSSSDQVQLPLVSGGSYDMTVYWGDGSVDTITAFDDAAVTHTYPSSGTYNVQIFGECRGFRFGTGIFSPGGDAAKLIEVSQWGSDFWLNGPSSDQNSNFAGCSNLEITATDAPDLSNTTNLAYCFGECSTLNGNFSAWNVSNVTTTQWLFLNCSAFNDPGVNQWNTANFRNTESTFTNTAFNQDLDNWNVDNVTNINGMFQFTSFSGDVSTWNTENVLFMNNCFSIGSQNPSGVTGWNLSNCLDMNNCFTSNFTFNQPIGSWNVSSCVNFFAMFSASSFDQDLSNWTFATGGVSIEFSNMFADCTFNNGGSDGILNWNTERVTSMQNMFSGNTTFNQPIGGTAGSGGWNVSSVTNMDRMFANSSFDQDLGNSGSTGGSTGSGWNIQSLVTADQMFDNTTLSTANYDSLLLHWANLPIVQNDVAFSGGNSKFIEGEEGRDTLVNVYNWTITDGGTGP